MQRVGTALTLLCLSHGGTSCCERPVFALDEFATVSKHLLLCADCFRKGFLTFLAEKHRVEENGG